MTKAKATQATKINNREYAVKALEFFRVTDEHRGRMATEFYQEHPDVNTLALRHLVMELHKLGFLWKRPSDGPKTGPKTTYITTDDGMKALKVLKS